MLQSPAFGLTYDVGHNHCIGGADEPHIFARLEKLHHMHLHDAAAPKRDHLALGTGELDLHDRLTLADACDCTVVLEIKTARALGDSVQWLREHWKV